MLVKILGGVDVACGIVMLLVGLNVFPGAEIVVICGIALLVKSSMGLWQDFGSWVDVFAGLALLLSAYFILPWYILTIPGVFILQKGALSFL